MSIDFSKIRVEWTEDQKEFMKKNAEFLNGLTCYEDFNERAKKNLSVARDIWHLSYPEKAAILLALEIYWNDTQNLYFSLKYFRKLRGQLAYEATYFVYVRHGDFEDELNDGGIRRIDSDINPKKWSIEKWRKYLIEGPFNPEHYDNSGPFLAFVQLLNPLLSDMEIEVGD